MPHFKSRTAWAVAVWVALGCVVAIAFQPRRGARPLITYVQEAIGAMPADCGYFNAWTAGDEPRPDRLKAALVCIADSAREAKPAWLRVYSQGFDSQVAFGLMVGSNRAIRYFAYDSDPSGGGGAGSRFIEKPCAKPAVDGEWIRCDTP